MMQTRMNYGAANATEGNLTTRAVVNLTDTANWQGLSKVFLSNLAAAANCANDNAAANLVGIGSLSGTLSLSVAEAAFDGDGANGAANFMLCLQASGTTALSAPMTIQSSIDVNITGTGANDPAAKAFATIDVWDANAYQGLIPWAVNSSTVATYCLINNIDTTRTATVLMDILGSEGAVVLSDTLGTIAPKTSKLATFTANSATLGTGKPISLSTLPADNRYAAKLTVTTTPADVSVTCVQTDPATGDKRSVPVFANSPNVQ